MRREAQQRGVDVVGHEIDQGAVLVDEDRRPERRSARHRAGPGRLGALLARLPGQRRLHGLAHARERVHACTPAPWLARRRRLAGRRSTPRG